MKEENVYLRSG